MAAPPSLSQSDDDTEQSPSQSMEQQINLTVLRTGVCLILQYHLVYPDTVLELKIKIIKNIAYYEGFSGEHIRLTPALYCLGIV